MKRKIGTAVLFVLLLVTIVAIKRLDTPRDLGISHTARIEQSAN